MTPEYFEHSRVFALGSAAMYRLWSDPTATADWMGPAGAKTMHSNLDMRPGGRHHYCMQTADGTEMWGLRIFGEFTPGSVVRWFQSFSDPEGGLTRHPMAPIWPLQMETTVTIDEVIADVPSCRVIVRWAPFQSTREESALFGASLESMRGGWNGTFDQLAAHIAHMA